MRLLPLLGSCFDRWSEEEEEQEFVRNGPNAELGRMCARNLENVCERGAGRRSGGVGLLMLHCCMVGGVVRRRGEREEWADGWQKRERVESG